MNVLVGPTVRCSFDDQECILRIILMQRQDILSTPASSNLTIYALKVGVSPRYTLFFFTLKSLVGHVLNNTSKTSLLRSSLPTMNFMKGLSVLPEKTNGQIYK